MSTRISFDKTDLWLTSFWGFDPETYGQLNFSNETLRENFLRRTRVGTLVFVYITKGNGPTQQRGKAVGLVEVSHIKDHAKNLMSEKEWALHQQNPDSKDRWIHALKITRAWRIVESDVRSVEELFEHTYSIGRAQAIGSQGMPVDQKDVKKLKNLRLREVEIFGLDKHASSDVVQLAQLLDPSDVSGPNTSSNFPPKFSFSIQKIKQTFPGQSVPIANYTGPTSLTNTFVGSDKNSSSRTEWFLEFIHLLWKEMNEPSEIPFTFIDVNAGHYRLDIGCTKYCFNNKLLSKNTDRNNASNEVETLKVLDDLLELWATDFSSAFTAKFSSKNGNTGPGPSAHQSGSSRELGEGYAYAFQLEGRDVAMIKIGSSKDWKDRLKTLNKEIRPHVTGCRWKPYIYRKFSTEQSAFDFEQSVIENFRQKHKLVEGEEEIAYSTTKELDEIWHNAILGIKP